MDVRLQAFEEALESLTYLVNVDLAALASTLDPRLIDGLRNGQAQKFEYTLELAWKAIKGLLAKTAAQFASKLAPTRRPPPITPCRSELAREEPPPNSPASWLLQEDHPIRPL